MEVPLNRFTIKSPIVGIVEEFKSDIVLLANRTLSTYCAGVEQVWTMDNCLFVIYSVKWTEVDFMRFNAFITDVQLLLQYFKPAIRRLDLFISESFDCRHSTNNESLGCAFCIRTVLPLLQKTSRMANHKIILDQMKYLHDTIGMRDRKYNIIAKKYRYMIFILSTFYQFVGIILPQSSVDADLYRFIIDSNSLNAAGYTGRPFEFSFCGLLARNKNMMSIYNNMVGPIYRITLI